MDPAWLSWAALARGQAPGGGQLGRHRQPCGQAAPAPHSPQAHMGAQGLLSGQKAWPFQLLPKCAEWLGRNKEFHDLRNQHFTWHKLHCRAPGPKASVILPTPHCAGQNSWPRGKVTGPQSHDRSAGQGARSCTGPGTDLFFLAGGGVGHGGDFAEWLEGSEFPDQGMNLNPQQ